MTNYYLDSSAIVKKYVPEIGSDWIRTLIQTDYSDFLLLTSRLSVVEVFSAFNRRLREGVLYEEEFQIAVSAFVFDFYTRFEFIEIDEDLIEIAIDILGRHPLRAYDSIHLASVIASYEVLEENNLTSFVFISADNRLNSAAQAEGLIVENPNDH